MRTSILGDKTFTKKLISLVLPIALQQLMLAVVSASDAVMLNLISQDKMAAVSLATQVSFVENLFLAAMTIGLSTLAAQYWGKGDKPAVERIFAYVMKITAAISLVFSLAAGLAPEMLMRLLTNEAALIAGGAEYLRLVAPSYLLTGISQVYLCALKNSGRTRAAGVISSVCMVGDMLMNIVLISGFWFFPRMEIAGAAVSTTIARAAEAAWCLIEVSKKDRIKLRARNLLSTDRLLRRDFWKYTTPVLGNEIVWGVGFTMFSVIMGHMGADAVAANSIAGIVKNLIASFGLGLAGGSSILIGNELGAGRLDQAKEYGGRLCRLAVIGGAIAGGVLLFSSPLVLRAARLSPAAHEYLRWMLVICSYYMIGKFVNSTTIAGIFCAGGDSAFGFLCDAVVMWGIAVPLGLLTAFVLHWPVVWVYFVVSLDELLKLPAVYVNYKKYRWVRDLTRKEEN